ncbi:hypothetical protein [Mycolicibacterium porcinum]|uniref:Aminopeptidase n=1 Tax=Mycolicibacterium porcinum TaxID=39693 RepID=A0ABV3VEG0_9MYCO
MPTGPHVPSISYIRKALEQIPDAIRYDDPSTDERSSGADPAIAVWISDPDLQGHARDVTEEIPAERPSADTGSSQVMADEPTVAFEIPPQVTEATIRNAFGSELTKIQQLSQLQALDAYAWYTTFHQKRFQYGVHIPIEGILAFTLHAFADLNLPLERKVQLAFHAILRHELFHFNVDCMTANWEMATGGTVFWAAKERHRSEHGYVALEEGLANAYMLRGFRYPSRTLANPGGAYPELKRFCKRQPEGYRDAEQYVKTRGPYARMDSFFDACCELSLRCRDVAEPAWRPPDELDPLLFYPAVVRVDWTRCPVVILDDHGLLDALGINVAFFRRITDIEETVKFSRSFKKLDRSIQKQWKVSVEKLASSTALSGLGFQPWKLDGADFYSVNVGGNYRAHLRYDRNQARWFAEAIGNHKEMGHG